MSDQIQNVRIKYVVDDQGLLQSQAETSEGFKKVNSAASQANKEIADGTAKSASLSKALTGELKNLAGNINIMGVNAGDAFNKVNTGLGGAVRGLGSLKIALIQTGIGAFLVALGSLVAYFKSTEAGSERLERGLAAVGAAIKVIIGRAAQLGGAIVDAIKSPIESIKAFGELIKENIVNRFKSIGLGLKAISEGNLKGFTDAMIQAATGVTNATDKISSLGTGIKNLGKDMAKAATDARDYTKVLQDIEDKEKNLQVEIEQSITKRKQLAIAAVNAGEGTKKGIALLQQAVQIEKDIVDKQLKLQADKVKALKVMNDRAVKDLEVDEGNQLDAYREAQIEYERIKGQSLEVIGRLQNKQARLDLKDQKAANKERIAEEKRFLKEVQDANIETLANQINIEEQKTDVLNKSFEGQKKMHSAFGDAIKIQQKDFVKDFEASEKAQTDALRAEEKKRQAIKQASVQTISTIVNSGFEIERNLNQQLLQDTEDKRAKDLKSVGDNKQAQAVINAKFDKQERKLKHDQAVTDRNQAIFSILLNTGVSIEKTAGELGYPAALPFIALAAAAGGAQLAAVSSRPIPKFNQGTKSVPGVDTGDDSVLAMVRPTEKIFPVGTSRQYSPALDAIFDHKIPASLINSFALDYDKIGGAANINSSNNDFSKLEKKLDEIKKTLANIKTSEVNVDKKGIRTFIKNQQSETEFTNNYFKS